jgi:hypothetical protein
MSNKVTGRCLNIGNCGIANSMAIVEVDESAEFICTECGKPLVASQAAKSSSNKSTSKWLAGIGLVGAAAAGVFGLSTLLRPQTPTAGDAGDSSISCKFLGFCSSKAINAASSALDSAELTAQRLDSAMTIAAFRQGTTTLERQLRSIEESDVYGDAQRTSLIALREKARQALQRLKKEDVYERVVAEALNDSRSIDQLPRQAEEKQRQQLLSRLQAIDPRSFSYDNAVALRERLQPTPPSSPPRPKPLGGESPGVGQSSLVTRPPQPPQRPAGQGSRKADQYRDRDVPLW